MAGTNTTYPSKRAVGRLIEMSVKGELTETAFETQPAIT